MTTKKVIYCLVAIFILALALRVTRCLIVNRVDKDAILYVRMSDRIAKGELKKAYDLNPRIPPLYLYLMAQGKKLGIDSQIAGQAVSVLFGALLIFAVFSLGNTLFGRKMALMSAFIAAIMPSLIEISAMVMRDSLFVFLLFASLAFAVKAVRKFSILNWIFAGIFCALATMTRNEGIEIILAVICSIGFSLLFFHRGKMKNISKSFVGFILFMIFFVAVSFPVQIKMDQYGANWEVFSSRIVSYFDSFGDLSKRQVIKRESR